jgi:peptidoglycan/xylan/chitin deacetylase (PgdA/CDA1 family)
MFPRFFRHRARRTRLLTMLALLLTVLALVTPFYVIYKPPFTLIRYFQRRWPDVLWHVPLSSKTIALTIDDAPSGLTRELVDVLVEHGATATFFVIGSQVRGRAADLEYAVRSGMELGNHAMHDEPARSLPADELQAQLAQTETYINATYAALDVPRPPHRYFRPGSGFFTARMRAQVRGLGFEMVLGSVYPHDAQIAYPGVNARHVLSMVRPGAILICHDRRSWTAPMLKVVLGELGRRGYGVTTVTGLLEAARREAVGGG